jgi:hypothetical protein
MHLTFICNFCQEVLLLFFAAPQGDFFEETDDNEGKQHQSQAEQDRAVDAFRQAEALTELAEENHCRFFSLQKE